MPDRMFANAGVQIGVESTSGTSVAASKKLLMTSIMPTIKADVKTFRPMGQKYSGLAALGKEWVEAKVEAPGNYTDLTYLLASLISYSAPSQQGGTSAYKWTFASSHNSADTVKTFTVEQGDSVRAHKFTYGIMNALTMTFGRDEVKFSGSMMGTALQDGITMTSTPTSIAQQLLLPSHVDIKIADTQAGLAGASVLSRSWSFEFSLADRFVPMWPLGTTFGTGPAAYAEGAEPKLTAKLKMEADATGMGLLTKLRAGTAQFVRLSAVGPLIAGSYYNTLQIDLAAAVSNVSEFSNADGVFAIEWGLEGIVDSTWGKSHSIELTNTLTAL